MSDLKAYIKRRHACDPEFADGYDEGYQAIKIGAVLRNAREAAGMTQEELAKRLNTQKSAISRIENHADDVKLSTLERFAASLGKNLEVRIL